MPGLTGIDAARAVKAAAPDVPVVLITGWNQETPGIDEALRASLVDLFLQKPFDLSSLQTTIAQAIAIRDRRLRQKAAGSRQ